MIRKMMFLLLLLSSVMMVQAAQPSGKTCYDPIPLGKDYAESINSPCTKWYTARTFDLPIKVCFTPVNSSMPAPEVEMDFGCTSGYYEDSILCSLFCKSSQSGVAVDMPHKPALVWDNGAYCISMGKRYRDLLLETGISYNVDVFVKVTFKSAGALSLVPDTEFSDCMDGGKFMQLGDTVRVQANDSDRYVILPYVQWSQDSIRYIWQGTEPIQVIVASTCGINPAKYNDERILDRIDINPNDTVKLSAAQVKYYAEFGRNQQNAVNAVQAGMIYAKMCSASSGVLKIERVPMAPPEGGATLLRYNKAVTIMANDTNALFALRRDTVAIHFSSPTTHILKMYMATNADFKPSTADTVYQFIVTDDGHNLTLLASELDKLWANTSKDYLYVRFQTTARTTVTPSVYYPSECVANNSDLKVGSYTVPRATKKFNRMPYDKWKNGTLKFQWKGSQNGIVAIGDTCSFNPKNSDPHIVYFKSISSGKSISIDAATMNSDDWKNRVDAEGNLYVLLYSASETGKTMVVSYTPIPEKDPTYPASTVAIKCIDDAGNLAINVSQDQHISIENAAGSVVKEYDAYVGQTEVLTLPEGSYVLTTSEGEKIALNVP